MEKYIGSVVVGVILAAAVALVIIRMVKDKKAGKGSCGCNCPGCRGGSCSGCAGQSRPADK